ncbi:transposase [Streptomyces sp. NPDC051001]|uniref:transposase n=1 Tax=Streptomyces sp. NPDC051001 TaxID=3155795 RepID=UPI0034221CCD
MLTAAGDNPDRLASEASFAARCGVSPVEASSGKTQRRRLNRGGDRQANSALYTIVIARLRWDTRTRSYVKRRVTEGKTRREPSDASNATWPARSTKPSSHPRDDRHQPLPIDIHRGIKRGYVFLGTVTAAAMVIWLRT